jgi:hypothetical protein
VSEDLKSFVVDKYLMSKHVRFVFRCPRRNRYFSTRKTDFAFYARKKKTETSIGSELYPAAQLTVFETIYYVARGAAIRRPQKNVYVDRFVLSTADIIYAHTFITSNRIARVHRGSNGAVQIVQRYPG